MRGALAHGESRQEGRSAARSPWRVRARRERTDYYRASFGSMATAEAAER